MDEWIDILRKSVEMTAGVGTSLGALGRGLKDMQALFATPQGAADADIKALLADLAEQVADTKLANADLKSKLADAVTALIRMKSFETQLNRYELWESPLGAIVYRIKEACRDDQPIHYICPSCVAQHQVSILQGHKEWRECKSCAAQFRFEQGRSIEIIAPDYKIRGGLY